MAKVAFVWLAQHDEVRPLELANFSAADAIRVRYTGLRTEADVEEDHTFVIIGRKMENAERRERQTGIISLPPYESWNFGAVILRPVGQAQLHGQPAGHRIADDQSRHRRTDAVVFRPAAGSG